MLHIMHWLWFALISVTSFSVSTLLQRVVMRKDSSDAITSSILFQLIMTVLSIPVALYFGFHLPSVTLLPFFVISAVLYAFGTVSFFRASQELEASESSILAGSGALVTIIASYVFLAERFSAFQLAGVALILSAVILVNYRRDKIRFKRGSWFALLGATCYGLAVVSDGYILRTFDTFSFLPIMNMMPASVLLLAFPNKLPKLIHDAKHINKTLILYSAVYVVAAETFYYPLKNGALVSQMSTILRASIIMTVVLGMIFLKERSQPIKKLAGAILTTAGILLIR